MDDFNNRSRKMNYGAFINPNGIHDDIVDITRSWWTLKLLPKVIHRITLDKIRPMTYKASDHLYYQPDKSFDSDLGSIPAFLQPFFPKDQFRSAYIMHDSEYTHGGVWVSSWGHGPFVFQKTSQVKADDRLHDMIMALDPQSNITANLIWSGVRLGGWASWCKGDRKKKEQHDTRY